MKQGVICLPHNKGMFHIPFLVRKDFWVELLDLFGLTFPLWCVGGDFNVIRSSSEKLGGSSVTSNMRDFDGFIRDCELLDPPLRNAPFTWSNM